jgi:hypothetical protein
MMVYSLQLYQGVVEFLAFVSHYTIAYLVELIDKGMIEVAYVA